MDIDQLRTFLEVSRLGTFSALAKLRNVDPSRVSRAVAALEDEFGARLFQRTTRNTTLTTAGEVLRDRLAMIVDDIDQLHDEVRSLTARPAGKLRLMSSVALGLTCVIPLIPRFRERYPNIDLDLVLNDRRLDMVSEQIDLAVRPRPDTDRECISLKLFDTRHYVCASPDYLRAHRPITSPPDLVEHQCILFSVGETQSRWLFEIGSARTEVNVTGSLTVSNGVAHRELTRAGLGPALLTNWMTEGDLKTGALVNLFPDSRVTPADSDNAAWLLYPNKKYLPHKTRVMVDFLIEHLRKGADPAAVEQA